MIEFNNLKENISKNQMIIGVSALVTIAAGTTIGFVACNGDKVDETSTGMSTQVKSRSYSLEIGASEVSAMDLDKELLQDHSDLGVLSTEASSGIVTLSNADSAVEVSFGDGSSRKSFTEGTFEETLIVHDKTTKGVSELAITLTVKKAAVTTATTTTTKATTTTTIATTTTIKTTKKTEKKKEDKSDTKTEVKEDNSSYEDDYSYDEPQYEEPAQQETPKHEEPKQPDPVPEPEPETEPEPVYDTNSPEYFGYSGHDAELFNYALSQGLDGWSASAYVGGCYVNGESNVIIGNPAPEEEWGRWGIWATTDWGYTWHIVY